MSRPLTSAEVEALTRIVNGERVLGREYQGALKSLEARGYLTRELVEYTIPRTKAYCFGRRRISVNEPQAYNRIHAPKIERAIVRHGLDAVLAALKVSA